MSISHWIPVSLIALLIGCVTNTPTYYVTKSGYNPEEVAWSLEKGTASIAGNAFMRQQGGGIVKCSGETVLLTPVGTYAKERILAMYGSYGENETVWNNPKVLLLVENTDPRYIRDMRTTICDVDGKFEFYGLPAGTYFVATGVYWWVGSGQYVQNKQGSLLLRQVTLSDAEHVKVTLHR